MSHEETRWVVPCPNCTGDMDADPCDEDCERAIYKTRIQGLYRQADKCMAFARLYEAQAKRDGFTTSEDHRIDSLMHHVQRIRNDIRVIRWAMNPNESFDEAPASGVVLTEAAQ